MGVAPCWWLSPCSAVLLLLFFSSGSWWFWLALRFSVSSGPAAPPLLLVEEVSCDQSGGGRADSSTEHLWVVHCSSGAAEVSAALSSEDPHLLLGEFLLCCSFSRLLPDSSGPCSLFSLGGPIRTRASGSMVHRRHQESWLGPTCWRRCLLQLHGLGRAGSSVLTWPPGTDCAVRRPLTSGGDAHHFTASQG